MIDVRSLIIEGESFLAITIKLPKTNFMAVTCDEGYIMCGALDVALLNEKLKDRGILAARAVGVRTIDQLLEAPLESVTLKCHEFGIKEGMSGKEALVRMKQATV